MAALLAAHQISGSRTAATEAAASAIAALPATLPASGLGERAALELLAPLVLGGAQPLGGPTGFAHMDPPTPWMTWVLTLWAASLNQNLLHPDVSPAALKLEARAIAWLAPFFGMGGGHLTAGSTLSNLTGLWAAREVGAARTRVSGSVRPHCVGGSLRVARPCRALLGRAC